MENAVFMFERDNLENVYRTTPYKLYLYHI